MTRLRRVLALVGASGPVVLTAAWAVLGARTPGYDALDESISAVAALGRPHAGAMQAALLWQAVAQGCVTVLVAGDRHRALTSALGVSALGTAGVALLPLPGADGPEWLGPAHSVAATTAFVFLHLTCLAGALDRRLPRGLRGLGLACLLLALPGTVWFVVHLDRGAPGYGAAEKGMMTVLLVFTTALAVRDLRRRAVAAPPAP